MVETDPTAMARELLTEVLTDNFGYSRLSNFDSAVPTNAAIRAIIEARRLGREEGREASADVADEHAASCAQARGNAGAMNDRQAALQCEAERLASLSIAAAIRARELEE